MSFFGRRKPIPGSDREHDGSGKFKRFSPKPWEKSPRLGSLRRLPQQQQQPSAPQSPNPYFENVAKDPASSVWPTSHHNEGHDTSKQATVLEPPSPVRQAFHPQTARDEDDLSSVCSNDSFLETERIEYYSEKLKECLQTKNWKEAKEFDSKLKATLSRRNKTPDVSQYYTSATIHYMLDELADAKTCLARIPMKKSTEPSIIVDSMNLDAAIAFRINQYDYALTLSHKSAKYARKFQLGLARSTAHYLSRIICLKKGDKQEADFYEQMIQDDFIIPDFIMPLRNSMGPLLDAIDNPFWGIAPPEPILAPRQNSIHLLTQIKEDTKYDGIRDHFQHKPNEEIKASADNPSLWESLLRLAIDADDDSPFARWAYRSKYMSSIWNVQVGDFSGYYPLQYAITLNKTYAAHAIISERASPEILDSTHNSYLKQPLQMAVDNANEVVVCALLKTGARPDAVGQSDLEPPLYKAVKLRYYNIVRHLLHHGAEPTCRVDQPRTVSNGEAIMENALIIAIQSMVRDWTPNSVSERILKSILAAMQSELHKERLADLMTQLNSHSSGTFIYCFKDVYGPPEGRIRALKLLSDHTRRLGQTPAL
ncbi:hypothetical protein Dda_0026 [Drechslerella dactyloides]|uniref:Ankyrin repeat protein n=1 Tax=Drechslerella dactyloides TaxID=74499 RepID=A0AAD6NMC2_DREDA|nr:hypothetical protein Dda_0026 [Drechslerella dactyloides]